MAGTAAAIPENAISNRFLKNAGRMPPVPRREKLALPPKKTAAAVRMTPERKTPAAPARKQQTAASSATPISPHIRRRESETAGSAARRIRFRFRFFSGGFSFGSSRTPFFSAAKTSPLPEMKTGLYRSRKRRRPCLIFIRIRKPSSCQRNETENPMRRGRNRKNSSSAEGRSPKTAMRSGAVMVVPPFRKLPYAAAHDSFSAALEIYVKRWYY